MTRYQEKMEVISAEKAAENLAQEPQAFFAAEEAAFDQKIREVCDYIIAQNTSIIFLAGPSSSGKTTTAKKLIAHLTARGKTAERISLDNFYRPRNQLPTWEDGSLNFETIEGLDIEYFQLLMQQLQNQKEADFPLFDFHKGCRREKTFHVSYSPDSFWIFEGLHALHPLFFEAMGKQPRIGIYVSVHSDFVAENGEILLSGRQLRMTRRIIRDLISRGSTAAETIAMWDKVLKGEQLYIHPYRSSADVHINTTHGFEPFLYRNKIASALADYPLDAPHQDTIQNLMEKYKFFRPCDSHYLSADSLIREFYKEL